MLPSLSKFFSCHNISLKKSTLNIQHSTFNTQHSALNIQHSTLLQAPSQITLEIIFVGIIRNKLSDTILDNFIHDSRFSHYVLYFQLNSFGFSLSRANLLISLNSISPTKAWSFLGTYLIYSGYSSHRFQCLCTNIYLSKSIVPL